MAKAKKRKATKVKRKKAVARKKPVRKAVKKVVRKPSPKPKAKPAPAPAPLPGERIGIVTHYYGHLSVAVVKLDPGVTLRVGDNIHVKGHTSDFAQRVESLQVGYAAVQEARAGDDFGLKVTGHAREHDVVYRVK